MQQDPQTKTHSPTRDDRGQVCAQPSLCRGKLLDALAHYGESLPHDSDDASLIRVPLRFLFEVAPNPGAFWPGQQCVNARLTFRQRSIVQIGRTFMWRALPAASISIVWTRLGDRRCGSCWHPGVQAQGGARTRACRCRQVRGPQEPCRAATGRGDTGASAAPQASEGRAAITARCCGGVGAARPDLLERNRRLMQQLRFARHLYAGRRYDREDDR